MKKLKIAVVGATGLVGQKIISILQESLYFKDAEFVLYADKKNKVSINNKTYNVCKLCNKNLTDDIDLAFFAVDPSISKIWANKFVDKGVIVVDNSSAYRQTCPLIVPEINLSSIKNKPQIICNPNCSTIQLAIVLNILKKQYNIKQVVVSTYQSVSGAGKLALNDLKFGTNKFFAEPIKENLIPQIGLCDDNGFSEEENKIMHELNKILESDIDVVATAIRVPVPYCHTESVYVKFENDISINQIKKLLTNVDYITYLDEGYITPNKVADTNVTYVCRLRQISKNEICFVVIADNLRRGAAYNAVKIAKDLIFDSKTCFVDNKN